MTRDEAFIREHFGDDFVEECLLKNVAADIMDAKLFFCNPDKNTECNKIMCYRNGGDCMLTKKEQFKWR